ncbi:MAG: TerB family tellurite resistance protein [Calditrichaceae bacterium]|nr:TerB family tellurite resistance protein [Calditrichaceae bacterium]
MLSKIEQFIKSNFMLVQEKSTPDQLDQKLKIATTALFLEMAYIDFNLEPEEEVQISKTLTELFGLDSSKVADLIEIAREEREDKSDIWTFAGLIKSNFTHEQKIHILEKLWTLIYTDGKVDKFEDRLIRKISTLLGLEHGEMISAKIKIQKKLNIE